MNVGDRIRLVISAQKQDVFHMPEGIGTVRDIDTTCHPRIVLISFGATSIMTSALVDDEIEVVEPVVNGL